jgi:hypothetical protein
LEAFALPADSVKLRVAEGVTSNIGDMFAEQPKQFPASQPEAPANGGDVGQYLPKIAASRFTDISDAEVVRKLMVTVIFTLRPMTSLLPRPGRRPDADYQTPLRQSVPCLVGAPPTFSTCCEA